MKPDLLASGTLSGLAKCQSPGRKKKSEKQLYFRLQASPMPAWQLVLRGAASEFFPACVQRVPSTLLRLHLKVARRNRRVLKGGKSIVYGSRLSDKPLSYIIFIDERHSINWIRGSPVVRYQWSKPTYWIPVIFLLSRFLPYSSIRSRGILSSLFLYIPFPADKEGKITRTRQFHKIHDSASGMN